jgi:hypothetical protein
MRAFRNLLVASLLASIAVTAFAHTPLKSSAPENGAVLTESPAILELNFRQAVRLAKVELQTAEGIKVAVDFKPVPEAAASYSISLPILKAGRYIANWTAIGADSHKIEGKVEFGVQVSEAGQALSSDTDNSHHH